MQGRYKRRRRLTKLLYVLVALFLFSLWNYYRNHPGIFYTHVGFTASAAVGCSLTVRHVRRRNKKAAPAFTRSAQYRKSRAGQSTTLRRVFAILTRKQGDVPMRELTLQSAALTRSRKHSEK